MSKRSTYYNSQLVAAVACLLFVMLFGERNSFAVPSFARQTGLPCSACHTVFPELTSYGRIFKLSGYTNTGAATITAMEKSDPAVQQASQELLKLLSTLPLSVMAQGSLTQVDKKLSGTQNDNVAFPQEFSLFLAGQVSPRIGIFSQVTYTDQDGSFSLDNTDVRYASATEFLGNNLVYGITANNNPTVQDVWNSTTAWGYPYIGSATAPSPAASIQLGDNLAQHVAGVGAYGFYDNLLYVESTFYRSEDQGSSNPPNADSKNVVQGVMPYWRVALQKDFQHDYAEVGTFGIAEHRYPKGTSGPTDRFTDVGFDAQYEHRFENGTLTAHTAYIVEDQSLNASKLAGVAANNSDSLNQFKADVSYYVPSYHCEGSFGYFSLTGDKDTGLYAQAAESGSRTGKPDSDGFVVEADYIPWLNTKFGLQYTFYDKFNGASSNYDGAGRSASSNNTLYAFAWFAY